MPKLDPIIKGILDKYEINHREALWDCHGTWVMYHRYCELIADREGVVFDPPQIIEACAKDKTAVLVVIGRDKNERSAWSFGEAAPYNNKNSYPFAMAEKRAKDRVILKLVGLSGHVYSEEEADDFKASKPSGRTEPDPAVERETENAKKVIEQYRAGKIEKDAARAALNDYPPPVKAAVRPLWEQVQKEVQA